jgi:ABC-type multidrug transport system fused ATPase/permease subunit
MNTGTGIRAALKWVIVDFLSSRRRWQAVGVFVLMLLGGLAELFTLAAVFPLLAFIADPDSIADSRVGGMLQQVGIDLTGVSLLLLGSVFAVVAIGAAGTRILLAWMSQRYVYRVGFDIGVALYGRMLHQTYTFHAQVNSSRIIAAVGNIQSLLTGMFMPLMQGVAAVVVGSFILGGLVLIDPQVAFAAIVGFGGIYALISVSMRGRLGRNAKAISKMRKKRVQAVQEGLGAIRDVLIDNSQPVYIRKFERLDRRLRDAQAANALISVAPRFLVEALGMIFIVGLALVLEAVHGTLAGSLPVLAVLALGAQRLLPLLQQAYNAWANVVGHRAILLNVVDLLRRPVPPRYENESEPLQMERDLALERVSFRYGTGERWVLEDVTLRIHKGARVGFIGKSGSGKTTLMDLVMGLLQPTSGSILVDDVVLTEANVRAWQRQIAHVSQHVFLADASITENVALGVSIDEVDQERVRAACSQAGLEEFIEALPEGYGTMVGEQGVRLSGGQRQRIGIARALYKRASVLVLDEATSALDDETEATIMAAVHRLGRNYTVLMIAHRLTTLRGCDTVFRLDRGRIVQEGSYEDVVGGTPAMAIGGRT